MKEFTQAMRKWQKSCSDPNSNAQRALCLLKSVLGKNVSHPPRLGKAVATNLIFCSNSRLPMKAAIFG